MCIRDSPNINALINTLKDDEEYQRFVLLGVLILAKKKKKYKKSTIKNNRRIGKSVKDLYETSNLKKCFQNLLCDQNIQ